MKTEEGGEGSNLMTIRRKQISFGKRYRIMLGMCKKFQKSQNGLKKMK